jgi:hypothetical protein
MKRPAKIAGKIVALALSWDGARWPTRNLPTDARVFLAGKSAGESIPSARNLTQLLAEDQIREMRICWVPQLRGGEKVLSEPFPVTGGRRLAFRSVKTVSFGDVLGVVYRRVFED